jgi:hypothetical protein
MLHKYISVLILFIVTCWSFSFWQEFSINTTWWCLTWVWNECLIVEINPENPATPESIAQDIVFSATYMVWTILTIVIIVCWLWYIFSSASGKDTSKYKKWLISAAIWAVLVRWAYAIVRLIQYIAKW